MPDRQHPGRSGRLSEVEMLRRLVLIGVLLVAAVLPAVAAAEVPLKLGYEGRLLRSDGTPETGAVDLVFSLYSAETGGEARWTETQRLGLSDGFYATYLGLVTPLYTSLFDGSDLYLEVALNSTAFAPRQRVGSVAYAVTATSATSARNVTGGTVDAASITVGGHAVVDTNGQILIDAGSAFAPKAHTHHA
jgi:hypothetical protein